MNKTLLEAAKKFQGSAADPQPGQVYTIRNVLGEELVELRNAIETADAEDHTDPAWVYDNMATALDIARRMYALAEEQSQDSEVCREARQRFSKLRDEVLSAFSRDHGLGAWE